MNSKGKSRNQGKQERSKSMVESIVEAATRVFKSSPFSKATTNRIAEVAGVSIGSLYQYFPNKESLIGLIIQRRLDDQLEALERHLEGAKGMPLETVIDRFIRKLADDSLSHRTLLRSIYRQGVVLDQIPEVIENRRQVCSKIQSFLVQNGHLAEVSDEVLSARIHVAVNGAVGALISLVVADENSNFDGQAVSEISRMVFLALK
ncbi:MAG: TetR/AcrR family transcriptional regulator [Bdellovibrionales bacterium]|nr:TetR/AcrR family transcriptional regulator [Bdellovibrionales bacterium]